MEPKNITQEEAWTLWLEINSRYSLSMRCAAIKDKLSDIATGRSRLCTREQMEVLQIARMALKRHTAR